MKKLLTLALVLALALASPVFAGLKDTDVDSTGPAFTHDPIIIHAFQSIAGSAVTALSTLKNREKWVILNVDASCRLWDGTVGTIDMMDDGVSILTTLPNLDTADDGVVAAGVINASLKTIASGSVITFNYAVTGNGCTDLTIAVTYRTVVATEAP